MARRKKDQRKTKKRTSGPLDSIPVIAGAAAAIGITTAALNRYNPSLMSDTLNRAYHALSSSAVELKKRSSKGIDIYDVKKAVKKFSESYDNYSAKYNPLTSENSLGRVFLSGSRSKATATNLYKNNVLSDAISELADRFKKKDQTEINKRQFSAINSLLRKDSKILYNPSTDNLFKFRTNAAKKLGANGLFGNDEIDAITNEAIEIARRFNKLDDDGYYNGSLKSVQKFDKELRDGTFLRRTQKIEDEFKNKLYDIDVLEKKYGSKRIKKSSNQFAEDILDSTPLTVREVVKKYKDGSLETSKQMDDAISELSDLLNSKNGERFGDLYWDKSLREGADGKLHSYGAIGSMVRKAKSFYDETIVSKVLKIDEIINKQTKPVNISFSGSFNPILEKLINKESDSTVLTDTFLDINGKAFKFNADGDSFEELTDLSGRIKSVQKNSVAGKSLTKMFGADFDTGRSRGGILDFHESNKMNPVEALVAKFAKFSDPRYGRNEAKTVFDGDLSSTIASITSQEGIEDLYAQYSDINKILKNGYSALDRTSASKLSDSLGSIIDPSDNVKRLRSVLNILSEDDESMVSDLIDLSSNKDFRFSSSDFNKELKLLASDPAKYLSANHVNANYIPGQDSSTDAYSILRKALTDDAFLKISGEDSIIDKGSYIQDAIGEGTDSAKKALGSFYSSLYSATFENAKKDIKDIDNISELYEYSMMNVDALIQKDTGAKDTLRELVNNNVSLLQNGFNDKSYYVNEYSDNIFVPNGVSPLDIIKNLNDSEKLKDNAKRFSKQFIAGSGNAEDITSATFSPFFFTDRLLSGFEQYGLGFSADAYKSTVSLASNIMLKRVLPAAGLLYGLSYLDFESNNLTGSGLKETFLSGVANVDLGIRKITDAAGLSGALRDASVSNSAFSYWSNEQEYQGYDERKEWYESGYSPVRSGRWWSFGSSSEFRGGKISYFTPSYLRRESSNYYDVSVYGSSDEKWKHSWIPTPRHPLSTLNAILDPYWLEEMHYEDRPYPVTGKMFEEGTPWGAILNPTVGNLFKPQKKMHQEVLQGTTVDVRALIKKRNEEEQRKANNNNYIQLGPDGVTSLRRPYAQSASGGGELPPDYNIYYDNGSDVAYYAPINQSQEQSTGDTAIYANSSMSNMTGYYGAVKSDLSAFDRMRASNNPIVFAASRVIPLDQISLVNESIKQRSAGGYRISGYDPHSFVIDTDKYTEGGPSFDPTKEAFDKSDFLETRSVEEWLHDASYSAKELGGIYGFALDLVAPPKQKYAMADASAMASFSGRFWDENIGGSGGDIMEIARRFFPHEDHSVTRINNIQNTMPEWIPERYTYGDPYSALPKGDMRFPGAGYETLNELHPDEYGYYGSFDRFKILADIAPWSQEYKEWHKIAKRSVQDPELQKEIKEIEDRVERQNSRHTFYNKNYSIDTTEINGIVSEVSNNTFKLYGSDKEYSVAGVDLNPGQSLSDFMTAGADVKLTINKEDIGNKTTEAIVFDYSNSGTNITKSIVDSDAGTINRDTEIGVQAYSDGYSALNHLTETIAHAPIPYIHNKFLRVNTPMEAWEEEELYGTSYSTWNHPIEGFIKPTIRKTMAMAPLTVAANVALFGVSKYLDGTDANGLIKAGMKSAEALTNPMAFAGGLASSLLTMSTKYTQIGVDIGEVIGLGAIAYKYSDNPIISTVAGGLIGATAGAKFFRSDSSEAGKIGAVIGLGISALKNAYFDKNEMFGDYIPEDAQKRWDLQEYFDRLKYVKYTGLYNEAARKAKSEEGVDIDTILNQMEYMQEENEKLRNKLIKRRESVLSNDFLSYSERDELLSTIDDKIAELQYGGDNIAIEGGEYTRAAIAYKKAAESTIYGLQKDAGWSEILKALPKNHRDFFMEFAKETDAKKREEIRSKVSDYENKVLDIVWNENKTKIEDNKEYFADHYLPNILWQGWKPNVSLDNVEIKTIENEGMMLSDFGFYESNANSYEVQQTPGIANYEEESSPVTVRANLMSTLSGLGLFNVDVSLTPSSKPGLQMFSEINRVNSYNVKNKINSALGFRAVY